MSSHPEQDGKRLKCLVYQFNQYLILVMNELFSLSQVRQLLHVGKAQVDK